MPGVDTSAAFISRWSASGAAERANYQLFLSELCDLLGVPRPDPSRPDDRDNAYVFERSVTFRHGDGTTSTGRIDLYRRGCFVLEAKQGSDRPAAGPLAAVREEGVRWSSGRRGTAVRGTQGWDLAMLKARGQAEQYARALPVEEGWPPFIIVVDVGHAIELYSEFSRSGKSYQPFPDPRSHRIPLADLADGAIRERLRLVWSEPMSLDPSSHSARVTRRVADRLALLARSLEQAGHSPEKIGDFLKHCLFTLFAEDVGLLPKQKFTGLLKSLKGDAAKFAPMASSLWATMKDGGFSPVLCETLLRFNGGLFESVEALALGEEQLELLGEAGRGDWRDVEPAIFGTLLERALDPRERHNLGAHYTPRAYVERLVLPTVVEPLREEWQTTLAAAVASEAAGDREGAVALARDFHRRLCGVRVLDPACGSGNFLYVTFEHLKRLEGEVLTTLADLGQAQGSLELAGQTVDPHQLLGIEVNPHAAAITDLVLWIGFLQWHFRTHGQVMPTEPVIRRYGNVECRDAVLAWDRIEPLLDDAGHPVTRWDGRTTKTHPVTGEPVPDETAREPVVRYVNPRPADWPEADYVVGNPPFIGNKRMRIALGDGYVEALRGAWPEVPETSDLVMYWWHKAAELTRHGKLRRFGLITTNSLRQTFNRKVIQHHLLAKPPLSLAYAIPDHPWVDSADGAAVRIAMTVASVGDDVGRMMTVTQEKEARDGEVAVNLALREGVIHADLTIGPAVAKAERLQSNAGICYQGFILVGKGFCLDSEEVARFGKHSSVIRPWKNGKDLLQKPSSRFVIDFFGLAMDAARDFYPDLFQHVLDTVKPQRDEVARKGHRERWWIWGEARPGLRRATAGLKRMIVTNFAAKHRVFVFEEPQTAIDHNMYVVASDSAVLLGVLSARPHLLWMLVAGSTLEDRPLWVNSTCFDPYPFPELKDARAERIRDLGEKLDAHRKRQQALHAGLTLTGMYNVLEKLRSGGTLTDKERIIHEQGLVSVLRQLHDDLDAAVLDAYGWGTRRGGVAPDGDLSARPQRSEDGGEVAGDRPPRISDEEILERLVALNKDRAREEEQGLVRWLRPDYQNPSGARPVEQAGLDLPPDETPVAAIAPKATTPWPKGLPEQVRAVRQALVSAGRPVSPKGLASGFKSAREGKVADILAALASLGQARESSPGLWSP